MYGVGQSGSSLGASPSGGIRLNFITPSDQAKFEDLFSRAAASTGSNKLPAMAVRDILTRSRVDNDSLAKIWDLSSIANAPYLTFPEFAIAMYLTSEKLRGKVVPATLPSAIREEVELAIATLASKEGSNTPLSQPSMPQASFMPQQQQQQQQFMPQISQPQPQFPQPQPQQFGAGVMMAPQVPAMTGASPFPNMMNPSPMTTPPVQAPMRTGIAPPMYNDNKPRLAGQDFASKMMPNQAGGVVDLVTGRSTMPSATTWKISPEEKQRYRDIFTAWNGPGLTYMPGHTAREVLLQSNLAEQDLMRIWHLADRDNRGSLDADEFAIAMHLIYRKLNGVEVPSTLPAELAAPSSVLKKFVRGYQSSPTPPPMQSSPQQQQEYHPPVEDSHTGYVSNARRKGPASRFRSSVAARPRMQSYDEEEEEQDDGYDNSAEIEELRFQISDVKNTLNRLNASNARNQDTSRGDDNRYSVEELKDKIRKTQEELLRASRSNPKYFENTETLLDLLETQKTLQDEIQYLCNRDIPVLARQLRGAVAELRDTKVRYGRKNDGSQDYMAFVEPTGPGGIVTESDRVRAKAKAMMAARKAGTSSSRDASFDLKKAEQEKEDYDRQADQYEREMERSRDALRDLRGELHYLSSLSESKAIKDKKRFDKGQDLSYELRRFVDQLERDSILGGSSSSSTPSAEPRYGSSLSAGGLSPSPKPATAPTSPKPPAASTPPPSKPRTAEEIKKEAERRVQERLAALQAKRSPSARSPKPSSTPSTPNEDELAAQRRLREVEQQAQQRLRESEVRQEEFVTPSTTPQDNFENERIQREQAEREQADREKADEERRIAEEKELEERRRAVLEKEEKQRLARLEAIQRAEDEREEERRREEEAALQKLQGSTPKAPEEPQQQPASAAAPPPPPPPPVATTSPATTPATTAADTNAKTSSNNPFAKLQQGKEEETTKSDEQEKKATTEQPEEEQEQEEKPVNNKRISYNPFAAFSAFSATKATGHDDSDSDDDGWDVVHHDDTDDENEFPAAGSAKNLAGMLFEAMSQRKSPMMANRELGSSSPKPPAADTSVPPPPPPPPPSAPAAPPPPPAPAPSAVSSTPTPEPSAGRNALLSQIQQGTKLRKAVTNDRSGASVAGHVKEDTSSSAPPPAPPAPTATTETPAPSFPAPSGGFLAELQARTTGAPPPPPPQEPSSPVKLEHHPEQPPAATSGDGKEYVTQWAYTGQSEDDLSFEQDDTVIVLNDSDPDWWYGTHKSTGKTGYFPKAYVSLPGGDKVRLPAKALYDFEGPEGEGCLSIQAGAELIILDKDADDWWHAEIPSTGKTGLVPANYVELD
ncbi:hypothetical protein K492DRAFT_143316 [Lichtheimia hyalospora FSU 10163]|nr:hypothetical protein K492DRAFT_143316 [Lichtheimia hyalospora FSU 10163]